jgi:hypothetical protein
VSIAPGSGSVSRQPARHASVDAVTIKIVNASETISLVSIGSGALVAITVPLVTSWRDDRRTSRVTNAARLDELRGVLETAGLSFTAALEAMQSAYLTLKQAENIKERHEESGLPALGRISGTQAVKSADEALRTVRDDENRIAIRLSVEHHLTNTYMIGRDALKEALLTLANLLVGEEWTADLDNRYGSAITIAGGARAEFFKVTAQLVGPDAPCHGQER